MIHLFAEQEHKQTPFLPEKSVIPPSGKVIVERELRYMVNACLDGWLTTGSYNETFEQKLAEFIGIKKVITTNSDSSANLVVFSALTSPKLREKAIKKEDEVISVAAGFPTTVNPIVQFGAIPVFVDVDIKTYNIDVALIESAVTSKTKTIMTAHTLGNSFNLQKVKEICGKYHLWLVEDCCDALGETYNGQHVGAFGDIAMCSFYPVHHITMGEGALCSVIMKSLWSLQSLFGIGGGIAIVK